MIAWAEKGTGLGPQCPESYFAIQIDIDVQRNVVSAACNHCAAGCLHCNGPGADQCTACPAPLRLYTHIDGRSTCVEDCPECSSAVLSCLLFNVGVFISVAYLGDSLSHGAYGPFPTI